MKLSAYSVVLFVTLSLLAILSAHAAQNDSHIRSDLSKAAHLFSNDR